MIDQERRERQTQKVKEWRLKNPERAQKQQKAWYEAHKEKHHEKGRAWKEKNPDKVNLYQRRHDWKRHYGITPDQYEILLASQGGVCGICGTGEPGSPRKFFCIDHDHFTGKVRGLLCNSCNVAIGHLQDRPDILQKAISYLSSHQDPPLDSLTSSML